MQLFYDKIIKIKLNVAFFHIFAVFLQRFLRAIRPCVFIIICKSSLQQHKIHTLMNNISGRSVTNITLHLIIINCIILAADSMLEKKGIQLSHLLGLHYYASDKFHWWQSITYMFMHGSFQHLFNNMFSLYMFGRLLEMVWGERRFIVYYLFTKVSASAEVATSL